MPDLSSAAKANLEAARQSDGKFGTQPHSNPGQLSGLTGPAAEVLDDLRTLSEAEQEAFGFRCGTHPENLAVEDLDDEALARAAEVIEGIYDECITDPVEIVVIREAAAADARRAARAEQRLDDEVLDRALRKSARYSTALRLAAELPATSFESDPTMQTEALTRLGLATMTVHKADGTHELRAAEGTQHLKNILWAERIEEAYDSPTGVRGGVFFDREGNKVTTSAPGSVTPHSNFVEAPQPSDALWIAMTADDSVAADGPFYEDESPQVRLDVAQRILRANLTEDDLRGQMAERRDEIDDARARHDRALMADALRSCAMDALSDAEARQAADSTDRPLF